MRFVLLAGLGLGLLGGCGSGGGSGGGYGGGGGGCTADSATATSTVSLVGMAFSPTCALVSSGTTVTFTNDDSMAHTVTTDTGQPESFDSGSLAPGASFTHTFSTAGTIAIHCSFHSNMHMSVVVQ